MKQCGVGPRRAGLGPYLRRLTNRPHMTDLRRIHDQNEKA